MLIYGQYTCGRLTVPDLDNILFAQASAAIALCDTLKGRVEEAQQLLLISSTEFGKQLETLTVTLTQKMQSHACFIRKLETDSDERLRLTQAR
jgi:hypothetical protein